MRDWVIEIHPDGRVDRIGIDSGKHTVAALNEAAGLVAFKVAGHSCWISGTNPRQYVPAHYSVYKIESHERSDDGVITLKVKELFGELQWNIRGGGNPL